MASLGWSPEWVEDAVRKLHGTLCRSSERSPLLSTDHRSVFIEVNESEPWRGEAISYTGGTSSFELQMALRVATLLQSSVPILANNLGRCPRLRNGALSELRFEDKNWNEYCPNQAEPIRSTTMDSAVDLQLSSKLWKSVTAQHRPSVCVYRGEWVRALKRRSNFNDLAVHPHRKSRWKLSLWRSYRALTQHMPLPRAMSEARKRRSFRAC